MTVARVLMIEDTPHNLELMTYLLQAAGHTVTPATTGAQGVELAVDDPPDLIILDIQLPDTTGYDVLARHCARTPRLVRCPFSRSPPMRWSAIGTPRLPPDSTATYPSR